VACRTIDFDDESQFTAGQIREVFTDCLLAHEFETTKSPIAQS
jgi:hypothetical protein